MAGETPFSRVSQFLELGALQNPADPRVTQQVSLLSYGPPASKDVRNSQQDFLVAGGTEQGNTQVMVTQMSMLGAYSVNEPGTARQAAWTFVLDGHRFYVLPLGPEGDWAYDTTTKEWTQFKTQGFDGLNFTKGVMWGLRIIGGDKYYTYLYEMDPNQPLDDGWRSIKRIVTGGIPSRSRAHIGVSNFSIVASVDDIDVVGEEISLAWSDDNGKTWSEEQPIALTGEPSQFLIWNALGSFASPGRIFRVTDEAGPVRIDGANVVLNIPQGSDSGIDQDT